MGQRPLRTLLGAVVLALACGSGTDGTSGGPSPTGDSAPAGDTPTEAPGPWAPSRPLALHRFALETAVQSALGEPAGAELSGSTRWTLAGQGVEVRLEVRTWFNGAEAELGCAAAAGDDVQPSLSLGTPIWSAANAVYVTQGATCIRVTVVRGSQLDLAGAGAVAEALVTSGD